MSVNVETMFSAKRVVPWHGLGRIIEEAPDSQKALELAGLDWEVIQQPIFTETSLGYGKIHGFVANVRATDGQVLGVVSDLYKIIQNREAFSFTDHLLGEGVKYETAGSLANGKRVWLLAHLPEIKVLDDEVCPYLVFTNGHTGKSAVKVCITPVRVVCQNTLNLALAEAKRMWSTHHIGNIEDKLEEAKLTLGLTRDYLERFDEYAEVMALKKYTKYEFEQFVESLFPISDQASERQANNVVRLRDGLTNVYNNTPDLQNYRGTAWGIINAVSDFVTHAEPLRKTSTYRENLFVKTIDGHPIIDRALDMLMAA